MILFGVDEQDQVDNLLPKELFPPRPAHEEAIPLPSVRLLSLGEQIHPEIVRQPATGDMAMPPEVEISPGVSGADGVMPAVVFHGRSCGGPGRRSTEWGPALRDHFRGGRRDRSTVPGQPPMVKLTDDHLGLLRFARVHAARGAVTAPGDEVEAVAPKWRRQIQTAGIGLGELEEPAQSG